jgi:hypothetical protein
LPHNFFAVIFAIGLCGVEMGVAQANDLAHGGNLFSIMAVICAGATSIAIGAQSKSREGSAVE